MKNREGSEKQDDHNVAGEVLSPQANIKEVGKKQTLKTKQRPSIELDEGELQKFAQDISRDVVLILQSKLRGLKLASLGDVNILKDRLLHLTTRCMEHYSSEFNFILTGGLTKKVARGIVKKLLELFGSLKALMTSALDLNCTYFDNLFESVLQLEVWALKRVEKFWSHWMVTFTFIFSLSLLLVFL